MAVHLLQLCPQLPELERALAERFSVHRWHDAENREALLGACAPVVRGVVTGGGQGIANELMDRLPALEIVAINGVGFDKVDIEHARARAVRITNTPDVLTDDVADLAIGLAIAALRQLPRADHHVRTGLWPQGELRLARSFTRQRFGIVGLGRIGKAIARRLEGFGVSIAYTGRARQELAYPFHASPAELASACDVLIVAAAAGPGSRHLIDAEVLAALGPDGVLVNVARGSLVDETALIAALQAGGLGAAALDVFEHEPEVPAALRALPQTVLAPHIGSATWDTRRAMADLVLVNLEAHFAGRPLPTAVV